MERQHNYRNYVHLEGRVHDDATRQEGSNVTNFRLAVTERVWDGAGAPEFAVQIFQVEVYDRRARYVSMLRKDAQVVLDGTIALRTTLENGVETQSTKIKAHRLFKLDFTEWRRAKEEDSF